MDASQWRAWQDNSRGTFDNITVQILPPQVTFDQTEDFSDGVVNLFTGFSSGTWSVSGGRYSVTPNGAIGMSLLDLDPDNLAVSSYMELNAKVNATGRAGVVFDLYANGDFKWAAFDVQTKQILIGHYTDRGGWVTDKTAAYAALAAGTDYNLTLFIKDTSVTLTVATLNVSSSALLSHSFNAVAVDGGFGLLVKGGTASFDKVTAKTDDAQVPLSLLAASAPVGVVAPSAEPSATELNTLFAEAKQRWVVSGLVDPVGLALLDQVTVQVADFSGLILGEQLDTHILIDRDAAGYGWFVDLTPGRDEEFARPLADGSVAATRPSDAYGRMDLLTVIVHEVGHTLGFGHATGLAVMQDSLETGIRRWVGENSFHVEGGVVAAAARNPLLNGQGAASRTPQAIARPAQAVAAHADFSRIRGLVGTESLIDWTDNVPGNGHTVDPSLTPKDKLSWVRRFLSGWGTRADESHADHELEVTLPGPRT